MFQSFIVTFREILEIAIIVGVMLAATKGLAGRNRWIALGFGVGILGSCVVAFFTNSIADFAEGLGQELFNALILFTAAFIIGWTAIWMRSHARTMVQQIKEKGGKIVQGELPKITLSAIIALAVLREGSEIVLFTYSMLAAGKPVVTVLSGAFAGAGVGTIVGGVLYFGIVNVPTKYIFQITTWILLLLTAGMSSIGAKYLVAAGYFENYTETIWNMSEILPESGLLGQFLHALLGYSERPMEIQAIFYIATLAFFIVAMNLFQGRNSRRLSSVAV